MTAAETQNEKAALSSFRTIPEGLSPLKLVAEVRDIWAKGVKRGFEDPARLATAVHKVYGLSPDEATRLVLLIKDGEAGRGALAPLFRSADAYGATLPTGRGAAAAGGQAAGRGAAPAAEAGGQAPVDRLAALPDRVMGQVPTSQLQAMIEAAIQNDPIARSVFSEIAFAKHGSVALDSFLSRGLSKFFNREDLITIGNAINRARKTGGVND
jgi:hypothetical protein